MCCTKWLSKPDKRNRFQFYCTWAIRATKNVRYVQSRKQTNWNRKKVRKLISPSHGAGVFDTVVGTAADAFVHHGIPWMAKKSVEIGRYGASELMRNKNLQKKAVNYGINELTPLFQDSVGKQEQPAT